MTVQAPTKPSWYAPLSHPDHLWNSSSYAEARKMLYECSLLAAAADHGPLLLPDILVTRGMSYLG